MSWFVLLIGIGLGVLWVYALGTAGVAAPWFAWLVFVAAAMLIFIGFVNLGIEHRRAGT
ncbi:MAG: hypothetical protein JST54_28670 [Deltaproteobacteria bacterium]|nr:hypothetical protein [Deltaproteobacteria bacterium]